MYREDFKKVSEIGKAKTGWLKENPIGYFVAAMVAGILYGNGRRKVRAGCGCDVCARNTLQYLRLPCRLVQCAHEK